MNNSIAEALSAFAVEGNIQQGLKDIQRAGGAGGDFADDFSRTLQALRLASGSADTAASPDAAKLTPQQLESLAALAPAPPEQTAAFADVRLSAAPKLPTTAQTLPALTPPSGAEDAVERSLQGKTQALEAIPSSAGTSANYRVPDGTRLEESAEAVEEAQAAGLGATGPVAANAAVTDAVRVKDDGSIDELAEGPSDGSGRARRVAVELASSPAGADVRAEKSDATAKKETFASRPASQIPAAEASEMGAVSSAESAGGEEGAIADLPGRRTAKTVAGAAAQQPGNGNQAANVEAVAHAGEPGESPAAKETGMARMDAAPATISPSSSQTASVSGGSVSSVAAQLQTALGTAQWGREFGEQLVTMTLRGEQQVSLHLNPRELGPLVVEQALPELRQIFEEQGLTLGDTNVSDHPQPDRSGREYVAADADAAPSSAPRGDDSVSSGLPVAAASAPGQARGRVDVYI